MARPRKPAPVDEPVTIDLNKPPQNTFAEKPLPDYGSKPQDEPTLPLEVRRPIAEPPKDTSNDDVLLEQVDKLKAATKAAEERAQAAEIARQQEAAARQVEQQRSQVTTEQAQFESIVNALAASTSEADQAQVAYESALAAQDHRAAAEAQRKMARAEARINDLENGKAEFERRFEQRRNAPQQQPQQMPSGQVGIEQILAGMPALTNPERQWLREHPDALTNQQNQLLLQAAYLKAQREGLQRDSSEYFEFFERELGYKPAARQANQYDEESMDEEPTNLRVAAPVSRSAPGVTTRTMQSGKMTLTPQQREAARISGIDEYTYAQNVAKLAKMKQAGYYQE